MSNDIALHILTGAPVAEARGVPFDVSVAAVDGSFNVDRTVLSTVTYRF